MRFSENIQIGNKVINSDSKTYIIAEAGVNYNCDLITAQKMIETAALAGVDAVKFQLFQTENLIVRDVPKAPYQIQNTGGDETQFEMLKSLEIDIPFVEQVIAHCRKIDVDCIFTPFDEVSLETICKYELPAIKIASTDTLNIPFLRIAAQKGHPIILSTGMCYLDELRVALKTLTQYTSDIIVLHCTANYPIDDSEANLNALATLRDEFGCIVGYSDHTVGVGASPYAVALGARIIEKHFTLDKNMPGVDQRASIDPKELTSLVECIRKVETYLGSGIKMPTIHEIGTRKSLQKCIVAKTAIERGTVFSQENIVGKRTNGIGISTLYFNEVVGRIAHRSFLVDEIIEVQS